MKRAAKDSSTFLAKIWTQCSLQKMLPCEFIENLGVEAEDDEDYEVMEY